MEMLKCLSHHDVLIVPRYSDLEHKEDASILMHYKNISKPFTSNILINAPMIAVQSNEMLGYLHNTMNCPVSVHRYYKDAKELIKFVKSCNFTPNPDLRRVFISVGSVYKWKAFIDEIISYCRVTGASILIDMANGDTKACIDTVKYIKNVLPNNNVMAGNVATKSAYNRLASAGADFVRCGIGGGNVCSTRSNIGAGVPTFTTTLDCGDVKTDECYIVADGGICNGGDICKLMRAGADMIMMGKFFASTSMNPFPKYDKFKEFTETESEMKYCEYFGMASSKAQEVLYGKEYKSVEGVSGLIPYTGRTEDQVNLLFQNLKCGLSYYFGCRNWKEFKRCTKLIQITDAGRFESGTSTIIQH